MKRVLYIKSNPKAESDSYSLTAGRIFIESYKELHPEDIVVEKDLYTEEIPEVDEHVLRAWDKAKTGEELTYLERESLKKVHRAVDEFKSFDKYVMVSPMWNFFMNWKLKKYIDLLFVVNKTFRYASGGKLEGLLGGRKLLYIQATGGVYAEDDYEKDLSHYYLKSLFGSVGVACVDPILVESTNSSRYSGAEIIKRRDKRIEEVLKSF
ncbi:FMN-dependent NADH-azoreductase 2 [Andreesenia angusta]|uniref:FMN dependent NADH:quinone oxidoreductase n=1 Tax=Andreesenia angusta TaxID=39480 RepID=A0A1S1V9G6_9FIRM|nr:NAD(P)H-dependent oxidoreductase [Andreesenia angusta]OHW62369.1 FMN-dependent NADH-azoreductase 2 [Andreesenia angusta]